MEQIKSKTSLLEKFKVLSTLNLKVLSRKQAEWETLNLHSSLVEYFK